jgi:hypothetical protein
MKRMILFLAVAFGLCTINKAAAQEIPFGPTGECEWRITGDPGNYTLTVSGDGKMADYNGNGPWRIWQNDIKTLVIGEGVTTIGTDAFWNCTDLKEATISSSVERVKGGAFYNCRQLTALYIEASTPPCIDSTGVFYGVPNTIPVYVPDGTSRYYRNTPGWDHFRNYVDELTFDIYHNPVRDVLCIQAPTFVTQVVVLDLSGKPLIQEANPDIREVNVSNLDSGVYLVHITTEVGTPKTKAVQRIVRKIIVI